MPAAQEFQEAAAQAAAPAAEEQVAKAEEQPAKEEAAAAEKPAKGGKADKEKRGEKGPKYSVETGEWVATWLADTQVEFIPHGKREGTKSYERYEKYSKARTLKEVLDKGANPEDLLNDFEKRLFKVIGGPKRETPLDPTAITDASGLTEFDIVVVSLLNKCKSRASPAGAACSRELSDNRRVQLAKLKVSQKYGVSTDALRSGTWAESPALIAARTRAANTAGSILEAADAEGRKVTGDDVLQVLRLWRFRRNGTRVDVMHEGVNVISCDRMGVMVKNGDSKNIATQETMHYPQVLRLFSRWLKDNPPAGVDFEFPFTSVFINGEYCARRHRDKANIGPTVVASFGDFTDGRLEYWAEDDKSTQIVALPDEDKEIIDIKNVATLIDGNRAHAVEEYAGKERFSLVFYVCDTWEKTSDELRNEMVEAGCAWPTEESIEAAKKLLPAPKGYAAVAEPPRNHSKQEEKRCHKKQDAQQACKSLFGGKPPAGKAASAQGRAAAGQGKSAADKAAKKGPARPAKKFSILTIRVAERWMSETKIMFPEGKAVGSPLNADRFKRYSAAKTIGEALQLGARPADLLNDYECKLLKPSPQGPLRVQPLRLVPHRKRNPLDNFIIKMKGLQDQRMGSMRFAASMGRRANPQGAPVDGCQKRGLADRLAEAILKQVEATGRRVTDKEVTEVLRRWTFHKNEARQNVLPEGSTFVLSDTLGLASTRTGELVATRATRDFPHLPRLLARWLKDRRPSELPGDFPFTSISLNSGYAARRHRDGNNQGPSMIRAFGRFHGGKLGYWPDDNKGCGLDKLSMKDRITFDVNKDLVLFDGNRAHEVDDFDGERYSVVFFTTRGYDTMPADVRACLEERGFVLPTHDDLQQSWSLLPDPRGYDGQRLEKFLGGTVSAPKVYHWFTAPDADEEKAAAQLLKSMVQPDAAVPTAAASPTSPGPDSTPKSRDKATPRSGQKRPRPDASGAKSKKGPGARLWGGQLGALLKRAAAAAPAQAAEKQTEQPAQAPAPAQGTKRKAPEAEAAQGADGVEVAFGMMQEGLAALVKAAKTSEGGSAGAAARMRPQLMQYMQGVLQFVASE